MALFTAGQKVDAADLNAAFDYRRIVAAPADQTATSGTTLINSSYLTLPILASTSYAMMCDLMYSAGSTGDFKVTWTLPSGAGIRIVQFGNVAAGASVDATMNILAQDNPATLVYGGLGGSTMLGCRPYAFILNSTTAGSVTLQFAKNAADATDTILRLGSSMTLIRV